MEDRVPGGRQRSLDATDVVSEEEINGEYPSPTHKNGSLPKGINNSKLETLQNEFNEAQTLDRKKKSRTPSFRKFMNKMVRNVSNTMRRSQSVDRARARSKLGSVSQTSFDDSTLTQSSETSTQTLKFENNFTPGVMGIKNHGNTCFMNAVLQCLCHTELLAEYFVTDHYKLDIKRNNKVNAKKYGTRGELTEQLAQLLKSLWTGMYKPEISSDFKNIVGKYGTQYRGFSQHDAQEFLLWLLDKVHEDLNIATKKKYRANKSSHGRSDEAVAAEALANHMRHNNSFVYDLFQAVYRSSLTCTSCRRQSNTFDPFLSVSLPIPQKTRRPLYVTVVYLDATPRQVRIGLLLNQGDTVRELRHTLAADTKIPESQLILTEIYYDGFHRTFSDAQPLSELHETDHVYAVETPRPLLDEPPPGDNSPELRYLASKYLLLLIQNKQGAGSQGKRFGSPLVMQVPRDVTYLELQNDILHNMVACLRDENFCKTTGVIFRLRVVDGLPGKCYLPHEVEHVLYMPTVDRALQAHGPGSGPQHLKLIVEWDQQTKESMIGSAEDVIEEHASVQQVKLAHQQPILGTLDECFRLYTQEEQLVGDDAWHCPNCRRRQHGTIKSLSLWNLPDILVIHLKRFKQLDERRRTKLNTLITFPETGLDMSQHISRRGAAGGPPGGGAAAAAASLSNWSPWRRHKNLDPSSDDFVYDLYAVCNHYGNMQGGHYTAFCRNPADSRWYVFDDTTVRETDADQIVTRAAYLLFYQRRSVHRAAAAAGGTPPAQNAAAAAGWIHQLMRTLDVKQLKYKPPPRMNQSHDALLDSNYDEYEEEEEEEVEEDAVRPVQRGAAAYATMARAPPAGPSAQAQQRSRTWTGAEAMDAAAEICSSQSIGNLDAMINSPPPSATQSREDVASAAAAHSVPASRDATPLHGRGPPLLVNRPTPTPRGAVNGARHTRPQPPQPQPKPRPPQQQQMQQQQQQQQPAPPPPKYNHAPPNPSAGFHPALVAMAAAHAQQQRSNPSTPSHAHHNHHHNGSGGGATVQGKHIGTFQPSSRQMSPAVTPGAAGGPRYPPVANGVSNTLPQFEKVTASASVSSTPSSSTLTLPNMTSTPELARSNGGVTTRKVSAASQISELNNPANWPNAFCMKESCV